MTTQKKLIYLWILICSLIVIFGAYYVLYNGSNLIHSLITLGCIIILLIVATLIIFRQVHRANKAKDGMIKAMAEHYHVDPKYIMVVDRIAYIDYPAKHEMLKINLVTLNHEIIHNRY